MSEKEIEVSSECCDAPVTWAYDGPICTKCKRWAVTKSTNAATLSK